MDAKNIVKRIASYNSLFGTCAKQIQDNDELSAQFVKECYVDIIRFPDDMKNYFEPDLIEDIVKFCQQKKCFNNVS